MLKYQLMISSDSPHELADLLLTLPDDTGDNLSVSATNNLASAAADNGYTAEAGETDAAPKRRGRKPKDQGAVAPPPAAVPTPPFDTDVSDFNPGVQQLAGVVAPPPAAPAPPPATAVPTTPAAPPAPVAPPSAPIPAAPVAPPPVVSAPQPIATPEAPTLEQLKDAMTILMSKVSVQEAQAILKKYTGFGGLIDLLKDGPEWAPIAHYVLSNYPKIPDSVQPRP